MPQVGLTGPEQFAKVAQALRDAPKDVRRESYAAMARAVRPLSKAVKAAASTYLPGQYGPEVAKSIRIRTRRRSGRNAGITLVGTAKTRDGKVREFGRLNQGELRHPLYGHRGNWYAQRVRPGFWDEPLMENVDEVRKELVRVLDVIAERILRA